ncbi:MAG: hypothetical protein EOO88_46225 [Pedobacter sp.]|nr:MAG: hypothetical protein EOO88_46225 [Pedobacter sp.]
MNLSLKKTTLAIFVAGSCILVLPSCTKNKTVPADPLPTTPTPVTPAPQAPPVETNPANSRYAPAYTGQTRIAGATTTAKIRSTVLTTSLTAPWGTRAMHVHTRFTLPAHLRQPQSRCLSQRACGAAPRVGLV